MDNTKETANSILKKYKTTPTKRSTSSITIEKQRKKLKNKTIIYYLGVSIFILILLAFQ